MDVNISWLCETFLLPPRVNWWQYPVGVEEYSADVSPLATDAHSVSDQTFECLWRRSEHHECFPAVDPWCGCTSLLIHLTRVILLLSALFPVFQVPLHSKLCFHFVFCPSLCRATYEPSPKRLGVFSFFPLSPVPPRRTPVPRVQSGNSEHPAHVHTQSRTHGVFGRWISRSTAAAFRIKGMQFSLYWCCECNIKKKYNVTNK